MTHLKRVSFSLAAASGQVSDETLAKINALPGVLEPHAADDVLVVRMNFANTLPWKDGRRAFSRQALGDMLALCPNTAVLSSHARPPDPGSLPLARIIDGDVQARGDGSLSLGANAFMLNDEVGQSLMAAIKGGIVTELSPTVAWDDPMRCSICGLDISDPECDHMPGVEYNGAMCLALVPSVLEMNEVSLVYSGMQQQTSFEIAAANDLARFKDADKEFDEVLAFKEKTPPPAAEQGDWYQSGSKMGKWFRGSDAA